jgi:MFS family permease
LLLPRSMALVLGLIGLFALGMAFITPNLSASISTRGDPYTGTALGMQNAANSLGQVSGPLLGAALLNWNSSAPYLFAGVLLLGTGIVAAARLKMSQLSDVNALSVK